MLTITECFILVGQVSCAVARNYVLQFVENCTEYHTRALGLVSFVLCYTMWHMLTYSPFLKLYDPTSIIQEGAFWYLRYQELLMLKYSCFSGCARIHPVLMTSYNIFSSTLSRSALTQHNTLPYSFVLRLLTTDWEECMAHLSRSPFIFDIAWYSGLLNKFAS